MTKVIKALNLDGYFEMASTGGKLHPQLIKDVLKRDMSFYDGLLAI